MNRLSLWLILLFLTAFVPARTQKVGLVLSGGGADALAHVGVIKALEENNIPIDYITGSSMGAFIGALYASGYSPEQIEAYVTSTLFLEMSHGKINRNDVYYYQTIQEDAGLINFKFARDDSTLKAKFPTNLIDPAPIDYAIAEKLAPSAAAANYNFDSLFVPFRCIAADISDKEQVIFSSGSLSQAVRASMSYPFYLRPVYVDKKLLFDGGLYNNFPADIMCDDFNPDFVIGSSVANTLEPPDDENPFSQIKNMMVSRTTYKIDCENGFIIAPNADFGVFNFQKAQHAVDSGYAATIRVIDFLKEKINRRVTQEEITQRRKTFTHSFIPLKFNIVEVEGLSEKQVNYVRKTLTNPFHRTSKIDSLDMRRSFFKLHGDSKIKSVYPVISKNSDSSYTMNLKIQRERDLIIGLGGNLSTSPINHIFLSVKYNRLKKSGITAYTSGMYGRLYAGSKTLLRYDIPGRVPIFIQPEFVIHRWNYYRSRNFFFEEFRPSYLIQNETYGNIKIGIPYSNRGELTVGGNIFHLVDDYYQTQDFAPEDTVDKTEFNGFSAYAMLENNTLDDKQYATEGTRFSLRARYVNGVENHIPGSTSQKSNAYREWQEWLQFKLYLETYYKSQGRLRLGFSFQGVYSEQPRFSNYTSTILRAPSFQPIPESKTLFLETFHTFKYMAVGHKFIFRIKEQIHLRLEGYIFQPYQMILENSTTSKAEFGDPWDNRYTIASATAVWKSPLGPFSLGVNYYHNVPNVTVERTTPITILLNFGYIIFNQKALD